MNPKMLERRLRFWREMVGITRPMHPVSFRFFFFSVLTVDLIPICMYIKFQKLIMKEQNLSSFSREKYHPWMRKRYGFVQVFMLMHVFLQVIVLLRGGCNCDHCKGSCIDPYILLCGRSLMISF